MIKVSRALISVSDKKGIANFAKVLQDLGVEILSTGGTASHLREAGVKVLDVSEFTGFPEMLDGRVKTLHPKIHGGLLAVRDNPQHMAQVKDHHIGLIDMVIVNLYPFEKVISKKNVSLHEAIENIDIGGPSMLRSASKNFKSVAVVCNPDRYDEILKELKNNNGLLSETVCYNLAVEAFSHTAEYDAVISQFLKNRKNETGVFAPFPKDVAMKFTKVQDLRYGENPHQAAAFYQDAQSSYGLPHMKQLHGKELSFNNILDLNAAVDFIKDFKDPVTVIIKHNNPTGIAQAKTLAQSFRDALSCDPVSAFGGIIGLNGIVDPMTAKAIVKSGFVECVIAPGFQKESLEILSAKKNLRIMEIDLAQIASVGWDLKKVHGGLLLQNRDEKVIEESDLKIVTKVKPSRKDMAALLFGWKIIKNVKSNAIVLIKGTKAIGIGCGQTSRVESIRSAIQRAGKNAKGSFLISDAFLPKVDNIDLAKKFGIKAIIQTGGSIEDENVIKAADKAKIIMVMTGVRHFKH